MQALSHPDTGVSGSPGLCIWKINSLLWNSTFLALEKCSITSETLTGVSPPLLWLPRCDNPWTGNTSIIAKRRGGMGGQALSPPLSNQYFVFHISAKGILQSHFFYLDYIGKLFRLSKTHPDLIQAFISDIEKCHAPVPCQTLLFHPKR